jgi:mRNA interferase MazF
MENKFFDLWNKQKKSIQTKNIRPFFREGEIRWIYFGKNIGTETLGKGSSFSRPALIFKKLYKHSCLVFPLTTQVKKGNYYFSFQDNKKSFHTIIFSQIRYIDGKRVREKISFISPQIFIDIQNSFLDFIKK